MSQQDGQKHTGIKALQQDTIDALDNVVTSVKALITETGVTQLKIDDLQTQFEILNTHLSKITDETVTEDDVE